MTQSMTDMDCLLPVCTPFYFSFFRLFFFLSFSIFPFLFSFLFSFPFFLFPAWKGIFRFFLFLSHFFLQLLVRMWLKNIAGLFNFTSPGFTSPNQILTLYKEILNPDHKWEITGWFFFCLFLCFLILFLIPLFCFRVSFKNRFWTNRIVCLFSCCFLPLLFCLVVFLFLSFRCFFFFLLTNL